PPSLKQRARGRLAMVHASAACLQAVELLYKANGGSSVYTGNPFDRRLRDMQTANQHAVLSLKLGRRRAAYCLVWNRTVRCFDLARAHPFRAAAHRPSRSPHLDGVVQVMI
ncbi:MAG TPA: hypothetical protein VGI47_04075, partial [Candidatus Binataceae bacterium]